MVSVEDEHSGTGPKGPDLREMSQALLRAIEAEPVPEQILTLARALADALAAQQGVEVVASPGAPQLRD